MPAAKRRCKVCGCEYEYCHSARRANEAFRWQDVACCPEHGSIYFAKIVASRAEQESLRSAADDADVLSEKAVCSVSAVEYGDNTPIKDDATDDEIEEMAIEI